MTASCSRPRRQVPAVRSALEHCCGLKEGSGTRAVRFAIGPCGPTCQCTRSVELQPSGRKKVRLEPAETGGGEGASIWRTSKDDEADATAARDGDAGTTGAREEEEGDDATAREDDSDGEPARYI